MSLKRTKHVQIFDGVSRTEAVALAKRLNVSLKDIPLEQFRKGVEVEREHANAVNRDTITIARIARDHLYEDPMYYDKLEKVEGKHAADLHSMLMQAPEAIHHASQVAGHVITQGAGHVADIYRKNPDLAHGAAAALAARSAAAGAKKKIKKLFKKKADIDLGDVVNMAGVFPSMPKEKKKTAKPRKPLQRFKVAADQLHEDQMYYDELERKEAAWLSTVSEKVWKRLPEGKRKQLASASSTTYDPPKKSVFYDPQMPQRVRSAAGEVKEKVKKVIKKEGAATEPERPYAGDPAHERSMMRDRKKLKKTAHDAGVEDGIKLAKKADPEFAERHRREVRRQVHLGRAESKARTDVAGGRGARRGALLGGLAGAAYLGMGAPKDLMQRHLALGGLAGAAAGAGMGRAYARRRKRKQLMREADERARKFKEPMPS